MKTRKRELKCFGFKVDDATCPCVETVQCDMPLCPIQGDFSISEAPCEFNPNTAGNHKTYKVRNLSITSLSYNAYQAKHCHARDTPVEYNICDDCTPVDYVISNFFTDPGQYLGASDTCNWCRCDTQIEPVPSTTVCGVYETDCDGVIWSNWSTCMATTPGKTCGAGIREKMRKCILADSEVSSENIEKLCYDPNVKRRLNSELAMKNNPDYYLTENCYDPCPEDLVSWSNWGPCTNPYGNGYQVQHENIDPSNTRVRDCFGGQSGRPKAQGLSREVIGKCNVKCGMGIREKSQYDFDTQKWISLEPIKCDAGKCPDVAPGECPVFGWLQWGEWSACTATCIAPGQPRATQIRKRCAASDDRADEQCENQVRDCIDILDCPSCTCTASNSNQLTAEMKPCNSESCPTCDVSVCGSIDLGSWGSCSATCGGGRRTRNQCFIWSATGAKNCDVIAEDCNIDACPTILGDCTCDSNDFNNLSAKRCDQDGNCEACDTSVCGNTNFGAWSGCSVTCGVGTRTRDQCFVWAATNAQNCLTSTENCILEECRAPPVFGDCTCDSDDHNNLKAKRCDQYGNCQDCDTNVCGSMQANWNQWSQCDQTCGDGYKYRNVIAFYESWSMTHRL